MRLNGVPYFPQDMMANLVSWLFERQVFADWGHRVMPPFDKADKPEGVAYRFAINERQLDNPLVEKLASDGLAMPGYYHGHPAIWLATAYTIADISGEGMFREWKVSPTREAIYYAFGGKCFYCGRETVLRTPNPRRLPDNLATVDHVIPTVDGGDTTWDNVVNSCRRCNMRKGRMTLDAFLAQIDTDGVPEEAQAARETFKAIRRRNRPVGDMMKDIMQAIEWHRGRRWMVDREAALHGTILYDGELIPLLDWLEIASG